MTKLIEVEIRGPLTKAQFEKLNALFSEKGEFKAEKDRIVLCYPDPETGDMIDNVKNDIRIRSTNGISELIIKTGKWGGDEHRREFSVLAGKGEFDKLVMMMGVMGFKTGVLAIRKGKIYNYKSIEFSVVEVPNHSFYFEAEIMVKTKKEVRIAKEKIREICNELKIKAWDDEGFYDYIRVLNRDSNEKFDFNKYKEGEFKKRFGI